MIGSKRTGLFVALMLAVAAMLSVCLAATDAEPQMTDTAVSTTGAWSSELASRFCFGECTVTGGTVSVTEDQSLIVISSDVSAPVTVRANMLLPLYGYPVNCLRIRFDNRTESDFLTLRYKLVNTDGSVTEHESSVMIKPNSDGNLYSIPVKDIVFVHDIELEFNNARGEIRLISMGASYTYEHHKYTTCGRLTSCMISSDVKTVRFIGEIDRATVQTKGDSEIAIFTLENEYSLLDGSYELTDPIVTGSMTTRFDLTWDIPADNKYARYSCFAAAVIDPDGSWQLIAPPFFVDDPEEGTKFSESFPEDAKGFMADDISAVGDVSAGVTVFTVELEKVFGKRDDSVQYVYNKEVYYLDRQYINILSSKISACRHFGVDVILRYSGWRMDLADEIASIYLADQYKDYTKNNDLPDGLDFIGALSAYTAENWAADGGVCAVILGDGENRLENGVLMTERIAATAQNLRKIYYNLISVNTAARVYVSLDPLYEAEVYHDIGAMPISEYIPVLISQSAACGQFDWELALLHDGKSTNSRNASVSVNDCAPLLELLTRYNCSEKDLIFIDSSYNGSGERLSTLMHRYIVGYYCSYFNDSIDAYIADAGADTLRLWETVRYIDTELSEVIASAALLTSDAKDFSEIIPGYNADKLPSKKIVSTAPLAEMPDGVKGEYKYFSFDAVSDIENIYGGYYCRSMEIVRDTESVLSLQLDRTLYGGDSAVGWMGMLHNFKQNENLEFTPVIAVTMKISGIVPQTLENIPVKLVLTGKNAIFESSGALNAGEWVTLYFDISEFDGKEHTNSLNLLFGNLELDSATVLIRDIRGLSYRYNDDALAEVIEESRRKRNELADIPDYSGYVTVGAGVMIAAATVATVALLSKRKREDEE